jgi:hypothetical protein
MKQAIPFILVNGIPNTLIVPISNVASIWPKKARLDFLIGLVAILQICNPWIAKRVNRILASNRKKEKKKTNVYRNHG